MPSDPIHAIVPSRYRILRHQTARNGRIGETFATSVRACLLLAGVVAISAGCHHDKQTAESTTTEASTKPVNQTVNESMSPSNSLVSADTTNAVPQTAHSTETGGARENGWGAATWGVIESEVRAAYPSAVSINPPDDYDRAGAFATLRLPGIRAAGLDFDALFLFSKSTGRLTSVLLRRNPEQTTEYERVLSALTDKYGVPSRSKDLETASVDKSSPEQEKNTRIGAGSATWLTANNVIKPEYFETIGVRHLIISYKPRSEEPNL